MFHFIFLTPVTADDDCPHWWRRESGMANTGIVQYQTNWHAITAVAVDCGRITTPGKLILNQTFGIVQN
jgi:hypothetical protein